MVGTVCNGCTLCQPVFRCTYVRTYVVPVAPTYTDMYSKLSNTYVDVRASTHSTFNRHLIHSGEEFFVCGGFNGSDYLKSCERFSFEENEWHVLEEEMPVPMYSAAAVGHEHYLYVIGGSHPNASADTNDTFVFLDTVFRYDTSGGKYWLGCNLQLRYVHTYVHCTLRVQCVLPCVTQSNQGTYVVPYVGQWEGALLEDVRYPHFQVENGKRWRQ